MHCTDFVRSPGCSWSLCVLALLPLAAGRGHAVAAGRLTRRSGLHSALALRWPGTRCARVLLAAVAGRPAGRSVPRGVRGLALAGPGWPWPGFWLPLCQA
jgi:hypothetical protein